MRRVHPAESWPAPGVQRVMLVVLIVFAWLITVPTGGATDGPSQPTVVIGLRRTEPSVAVNPRDPLNVVAAANPTYDTNALRRYPAAAFSSFDGGRTWRGAPLPAVPPFWTGADTSVAFDHEGTAYYGILGENSRLYCAQTLNTAAVLVARSIDGGRTVLQPVVVDVNPAEGSDDKPYIAVRDVPASPAGAVYAMVTVVWTRWLGAGGSRIMLAISRDGGRTFSAARTLYVSAGSNMGAMPAAGPHGELYVAWAHWTSTSERTPMPLRILVARSLDGGSTFGPPARLAPSWGLPLMMSPGLVRAFSIPAIAVNAESGVLYVVWPRAAITTPVWSQPIPAEIVLSRSTDRGATWSRPLALNDTWQGDRFMPALALLRGGIVAAVFYDRRADRSGYDVYLAVARDTGARLALYPNQRLTRRTSPMSNVYYIAPGKSCYAPGRWIGDYISLAPDPGGTTLSALWADGQRGGRYQTDLRYARIPFSNVLAGTPRLLAPFSPLP